MTTTSSIPAAISYLYQQALSAYPAATTHVFDGPTPYSTQIALPDRVWIGHNPLTQPGIAEPVMTGDQQFATLGARSRDETYQIVCAVEHWTGDTTMATARAAAFGLLRTFELLMRGVPATGAPGDATLGGAVLYAQVSGGIETYQDQDDAGATCMVVFHVATTARLTTG